MVKVGLSEDQINIILEQAGIREGSMSAENIRIAIAKAIVENNKAIDESIRKYFHDHDNHFHSY